MSSFCCRFGVAVLALAMLFAPVTVRAADDEADPFYEGYFGANLLFISQAHLSIGVLGDAVAKGVYEGEQGAAVAKAQGQLIEAAQGIMLSIAKKDDTDEEDAKMLKKMAKTAGFVKEQCDAIEALAGGDKKAGATFGTAREATQKSLDALAKEVGEYLE